MKKLLPILLLLPVLVGFLAFSPVVARAEAPATTTLNSIVPEPGQWIDDADVTFAGKNAKRSGDLLDWVIRNYQWSYVGNGAANPFLIVWSGVRNIMYAMVPLGIIAAAFMIIITRGRNIEYKKFAIRLLIVVALITLSFVLIQFVYQLADLIQQFFLKRGNGFIASKDLLSVSFDYQNFRGLRRYGPEYDEAAFVSMLLVKLTAASYYAMFLVLMIRKIILWFFIVISPIFALLFLFSPLRNTGKIWLGEFLRWTLYGPLFAVLLSGLVVFWQNWTPNAPLHFNGQEVVDITKSERLQATDSAYVLPCSAKPEEVIYPTAINILIGGPCQVVGNDNNVNVPASFIQYLVAILMIWMVILLPFVLLKIFLDYLNNFEYNESNLAKYVAASRGPLVDRFRNGAKPAPPGSPLPSLSGGLAKQIPIGAEASVSNNAQISENMTTPLSVGANQNQGIDNELAKALQQNLNKSSANEQAGAIASSMTDSIRGTVGDSTTTNLSNLANLSIPNMADIAKLESAMLSSDAASRAEASKMYEALNRIAGTSNLTTPAEKDQYSQMTQQLMAQAESGNKVAGAIISASSAVGQASRTGQNRIPQIVVQNYQAVGRIADVASIPNMTTDMKLGKVEEALKVEVAQGNSVASALLANVPVAPPNAPVDQKTAQEQAYLHQYEAVSKVTQAAQRADLNEEQKLEQIKTGLEAEAKTGNPLAVSILGVLSLATTQLPDQNNVQQVNLDDYEQVKKTWTENYRNLEVPSDDSGAPQTRTQWLQSEVAKIPQAITLMQSTDPAAQQQAKQQVSKILPFLLLGGFSKAEIAGYLKAKEEAAKIVLAEQKTKDNDVDLVDRAQAEAKPKSMTLEANLDNDKPAETLPTAEQKPTS